MDHQAERDTCRKLKCLDYGKACGNISHTCSKFGISRETYYQWRRAYAAKVEAGLINNKQWVDSDMKCNRASFPADWPRVPTFR